MSRLLLVLALLVAAVLILGAPAPSRSEERAAALDPALIVVAHISDVMPRQGREWRDADRDVLPGDGILRSGTAEPKLY